MSLIQISHLSFEYEGGLEPVFADVSLSLDTDWRLGLVGRNGKGKTTLLRLLAGELPDGGSISANVALDYFPFPVAHPEYLTGEVLEETTPEVERWRVEKELAALELSPDILYRPFSTLSNGERTRCLLALLFSRPGRFLLIDEPTNHLDMEGRDMAARYLRRQKGFILVSHDRAFLDACVDHILSIERSGVGLQQGNFSSWWENRQRQETFELAENQKLQREIGQLAAAQRRAAGWSDKTERSKFGQAVPDRGYIGHKSAKMMKRAKSIARRREAAVEQTAQLLHNVEKTELLELRPLSHPKQRLAELRQVSVDYGGGALFSPVSLTLERGDRVALTGRNGAGKSSLLRLLAGEDIPHTGQIDPAPGLVVSYVPQDASFLRGLPADYARSCGVDLTRFLQFLRKLDFPRALFDRDMATYSAGQKKKVLLARSLSESAHLYIWDEPLNYIDVFSRMQLEELLRGFPAALLLVEHDRRFLEGLHIKTLPLDNPAKTD